MRCTLVHISVLEIEQSSGKIFDKRKRERERERGWPSPTKMNGQNEIQIDRQTGRQTDRQIDIDRQTDR